MTVSQFVAHRNAGKVRVFGLVRDAVDSLEVVTSLGTKDAHMTDDLVRELNYFLIERDEAALDALLAQLPQAVQMAVRAFLKERCQAKLGTMSVYGAVEPLKTIHVSDRVEFREFLGAAYLIGLGIEASNEVDEDGATAWAVHFLTAEPFVRASEGSRAWTPPKDVPLSSTWSSRDHAGGDIIDHAVRIAETATSRGCWVHLHSFEQGDDERTDSSSYSEIVIDVFDAPVPPSDDDPEM